MRILIVALLVLFFGSSSAYADNQRPSTVNNVQASAISSSSIRVSWNKPWDNVGIDGYNVYRNGSYYKTVFNTTNYLDRSVSSNSRYEYSIVAFDKARNYSTLSARAAATAGGSSNSSNPAPQNNGAPSTPSGLRAEAQGSDKMKVQWNAPSGNITGYNLYRDGGYHVTVKGKTNFTAVSLNPSREYRWRVVAFNGNKYSGMSAEVRATTGSPSTGSATTPENNSSSVPQGYQLAFSDEFRSRSIDSGKWQSRYRWGPQWTVNNEEQFYIDTLNDPGFGYTPFQFNGEHLTITAVPTPSQLRSKANNQPYLSGALTTYGKFKMRYGYVEMRAKLPKGKGLWPAFWLLHNQENGSRPEIDVVEMLGDKPNRVYQTYHYYENWSLRSTPSYQVNGIDFSSNFHTFGMKWEPGRISWYVDGKLTNSYSDSKVAAEDMYLLVNLAVGGSWPGSPNGNTAFPARLTIDYIRAYRPG